MVVIQHEIAFGSRRGASLAHEGRLFTPPAEYGRTELIPLKTVPYAAAKRAMDIALALLFLLGLAPLLMVVAALVKLTSRGPAIFKQTRVGEGGRLFTFYKFRSMYADAEERRSQLLSMNEASGPVFKIKNDPRITPLGRIIRKYSIDEMPQFYNVLRGDLSIVGPRPPIPSEVAQYGERERGRLSVRPGLTCLWQISGRSDIQFDRWMDLDLQYIQTMSLRNDLTIFFQTIPAVLTARGAH